MSSKEEMKPERRGVQLEIPTSNDLYEPKNDFWSKDLDNQYFRGPRAGRGAYASVCVLNPILTIEHRDREYHIAVNFHLETTILGYSTQKSNDNEWFFSDVTLQYLSKFSKEKLVTEPVSDPTSAFAVTRSSHTAMDGNVGVTASQVPSANVSLGITRSRDLSVEYKMKTWSVSAHQVAQPADASLRDRPRSVMEYFHKKIGGNGHSLDRLGSDYRYMSWQEPPPTNLKCPRYQWFWVGNQEETEVLTPDLRHSVKRHIVMKRVIKDADFPVNGVDGPSEMRDVGARKYQKSIATLGNGYQQQTLKDLLNFSFRVQIRVMKKHGRLHRFFTISNNKVKGSILTPYYVQGFQIGVKVKSIPDGDIPPQGPKDTESIPATLAEIKENNIGDYDKLHGQNLNQVKKRQIEQAQSAHRPTYTRVARKYLSIETLRELRIDYTLDTDPDYIVIRRWVPENELDFICNHTRELRDVRRRWNEFEAIQKHEKASPSHLATSFVRDQYRGTPEHRELHRETIQKHEKAPRSQFVWSITRNQDTK